MCVCVLAHAHLSVSVCLACMCIQYVCVCARGSPKCVFTASDRRGEGLREVLSRNRASNVSYYTPQKREREGEKKRKRGRRRETLGFFSSEAFNWEFMEAAAVENEDLLCGLRSPDSCTL